MLAVIATLDAGPAVAAGLLAMPLAETTVRTVCVGQSTHGETIGPLPTGLSSACDISGLYSYNDFGPARYSVSSSSDAGLGPAIPLVGIVAVSAESTASNEYEPGVAVAGIGVQASAQGTVSYYFQIEQVAATPFAYVPDLYFRALGEADSGVYTRRNGVATASYSAFASIPVAGIDWRLSGTGSKTLDEFVYKQIPVNDAATPYYAVILEANCGTSASVKYDSNIRTSPTEGNGAAAWCHAAIDPVIRLAQEAFDAEYGDAAFRLDDYFRVNFSENVSAVPLPASGLLLGGALLPLLSRARRSRSRR